MNKLAFFRPDDDAVMPPEHDPLRVVGLPALTLEPLPETPAKTLGQIAFESDPINQGSESLPALEYSRAREGTFFPDRWDKIAEGVIRAYLAREKQTNPMLVTR